MINVLEYLEASAELYRDSIMLEDDKTSYTYGKAVQLSKCIGESLLQDNSGDSPVAILMEKSCEAVIAMFGVVYGRGCYSFIDVSQPKKRIKQMLDTLGSEIIITDGKHYEYVRESGEGRRIILVEDMIKREHTSLVLEDVDADTPLYVMFTSGSTGKPKGVKVSHGAVRSFTDCFAVAMDIKRDEVLGNQAPFDFDVSVKDIYCTVKTGARLVLIPKQKFISPAPLLDYIDEKGITTLIWSVSALCLITSLRGFEYKRPSAIRKVIFSGEVMHRKHLLEWIKTYPKATFVNAYGPTEITCNCTYYIVDNTDVANPLPIGKALDCCEVFLTDVDSEGCGELCVSGDTLALGYVGDEEETKRVFVSHIKASGRRMYKTGDRARINTKGEYEYIGRNDFQIKHNGFRIEPREIEAAAISVDGVNSACVVYDDAGKEICLLFTGNACDKAVRTSLKEYLPKYMQPMRIINVDKLPVTQHGKPDRNKVMEIVEKVKYERDI